MVPKISQNQIIKQLKNERAKMKKFSIIWLTVVFAILLVLFASSCNTINSKLQDEYIRPGLSQGMCGVFDKYRIIARELYWSVSGKLWERAEMPFLRLNGKSELREICK